MQHTHRAEKSLGQHLVKGHVMKTEAENTGRAGRRTQAEQAGEHRQENTGRRQENGCRGSRQENTGKRTQAEQAREHRQSRQENRGGAD